MHSPSIDSRTVGWPADFAGPTGSLAASEPGSCRWVRSSAAGVQTPRGGHWPAGTVAERRRHSGRHARRDTSGQPLSSSSLDPASPRKPPETHSHSQPYPTQRTRLLSMRKGPRSRISSGDQQSGNPLHCRHLRSRFSATGFGLLAGQALQSLPASQVGLVTFPRTAAGASGGPGAGRRRGR